MPDKPKLFISHITEEQDLAAIYKEELSKPFLNLVDVFVSSDDTSIRIGQQWLAMISAELKAAEIMLVLCSSASVDRPWINFEAGAGWVKDIPVIPICHSGMTKGQLPIPLKMLQAMEANEERDLRRLVDLISSRLGCKKPSFQYARALRRIADFERTYTHSAPRSASRADPALVFEVTFSYSIQPADVAAAYKEHYSTTLYNEMLKSRSTVACNVRLHNNSTVTAKDVCVVVVERSDRGLSQGRYKSADCKITSKSNGQITCEASRPLYPGSVLEIIESNFSGNFPNTTHGDTGFIPYFKELGLGLKLYREDADPQQAGVTFTNLELATDSQSVTKKLLPEPLVS